MRTIDPITLELVRCRLVAGAQQMAASLWKSSFSTVIREVLDYSTALFDAQGQMVAQSAQLPFQMMTMSAPLQKLVNAGYRFDPQDVVILNDPYLCDAQHLPDFMVFRPIFSSGRVVAFAGAVAHMIDAGGGAPGSYLSTATEIFHEGLRIPPMKLMQRGVVNQELMDLIALNVREPEKVRGDLTAMAACTSMGEQAVLSLVQRFDLDTVTSAMDEVLAGSERQLRQRLLAVPAGIYEGEDFVDDDGITGDAIGIKVRLTFAEDGLTADFTGTVPQARGPVNATLEMTRTTVNYVIMAVFGQGIAKTDGCRRVVTIHAPRGSVVNAVAPAPVASRVTVCHRVVDVMMRALAMAVPERVMAGYYGVSNICNLGGINRETGKQWVHFEIEVGGWGARPGSDGLDGFSAHIHNLANTPIEVVESTVPLRVERYELLRGSGGQGRYRGGLGLRRDIRMLESDISLNLLGDRSKFPPAGVHGGQAGAGGRYVLNPDTPNEKILLNKLSNYAMKRGDVVSIQTPGGGGYGDPAKRDPSATARDQREQKI